MRLTDELRSFLGELQTQARATPRASYGAGGGETLRVPSSRPDPQSTLRPSMPENGSIKGDLAGAKSGAASSPTSAPLSRGRPLFRLPACEKANTQKSVIRSRTGLATPAQGLGARPVCQRMFQVEQIRLR